jgi:hypothetical protein
MNREIRFYALDMYKKKEADRASLLCLQFNLGDEIFAEFLSSNGSI